VSKFGKIAGVLAVVLALAVGTVVVASAEGPRSGGWNQAAERAGRMQAPVGEGTFRGYGQSSMDRGRFERGYALRGPGSSIVNVAADLMENLTVQELVTELENAKSIADVAGEQGVALQEIIDAWLADRAEFLSQAVEAGRITQEEADEKLAHMEEEVLEHLQGTWPWEHEHADCETEMHQGLGGFGAGRSFGGCR